MEAGPSADCSGADESIRGATPVLLEFLVLDRVGRLLSDEGGSAEAEFSADWTCSAAIFALRAALASAARFFFARSPMVDRKQCLGSFTRNYY